MNFNTAQLVTAAFALELFSLVFMLVFLFLPRSFQESYYKLWCITGAGICLVAVGIGFGALL